ncbi:MAG: hypothetical protein KKB20_25305 [Proteobacteria bacterium]|nr:hypothetical protein [Pseudomonadota bacterium]
MNQTRILNDLEELAERLGLRVRYEKLENGEHEAVSGRYRLRAEEILLIDRRLDPAGRIAVLSRELSRMDLGGVFVKPYLRDLLETGADSPA